MNLELSIKEKYEQTKNKKGYKSFYQVVFKRAFDLIASTILIPFIFLIILPFAIAIKIEDGGPIFYKSKRIGRDFKKFNMLKLRSMKVNAPDIRNEDGGTFNSKDDFRVTKVGRFIRETSLDELPQIFNIFVGHMSFLGPRAGDLESKDTYLDDEKDKLLVRPGLTGYTQAYYRNGLNVRTKRLFDAWYSHNVSLRLDVKIFFKSIITVFKRDNIYTNDSDSEIQNKNKKIETKKRQ